MATKKQRRRQRLARQLELERRLADLARRLPAVKEEDRIAAAAAAMGLSPRMLSRLRQ